jgi:Eukaryotic aspartyl protease
MVGLNPRQLSSDRQRQGHTSNLASMKARGIIPSLSYGYTAGAKYRKCIAVSLALLIKTGRQGSASKPAHTQLILGGYDKAMFVSSKMEFKMGPENSGRDLDVWVRNIQYSNNATATVSLSSEPFNAMIDTSTSLYWLPPEVCEAFANLFHLRYNATVDLYLVNETLHDQLSTINPSISFSLGNDPATGKDISLNLPYEAFELKLSREYSPGHQWSRYFPIRATRNASQYTLGRAFLQETYLVANYETRNFSVNMRTFEADRPNIAAIRDPSKAGADESSSAATYGLIAGGCTLAALLILLLAWKFGKRRSRDEEMQTLRADKNTTELDSTSHTIYEADGKTEIYELPTKSTRVEAINPDMKCAFDTDEQNNAEFGPFELPGNEVVERIEYVRAEASSSASSSADAITPTYVGIPPPAHFTESSQAAQLREDELISPIEGTYMGTFTFNQTISPITPTEPGLNTMLEQNASREKSSEKSSEKSPEKT